MLNHIIVAGRLTHTPELRRTQSGISVCSFSVACDRDFKAPDGTRETDFIDVVAWRQTAEFVAQYLSKGRMAIVEGRLQLRDYTGRDGAKKRAAEIVADRVYFADKKPEGQGQQGQQYGGGYSGGGYGQYGNGGGYGGQPPAPAPPPASPAGDGVPVYAQHVDPDTGEYNDEDGDLPF